MCFGRGRHRGDRLGGQAIELKLALAGEAAEYMDPTSDRGDRYPDDDRGRARRGDDAGGKRRGCDDAAVGSDGAVSFR